MAVMISQIDQTKIARYMQQRAMAWIVSQRSVREILAESGAGCNGDVYVVEKVRGYGGVQGGGGILPHSASLMVRMTAGTSNGKRMGPSWRFTSHPSR